MLIPVYNPPIDDLEVSFLSQGISAAVTSITIDNNNSFVQNDYILLGREGREKSEIVQITGVVSAGTALVTGATVFPHEAGEPVTRLRYNQIKYWRSTTGKTGTYSLLTTVAVDVDNADLQTTYDDTTGLSTYYYKVSYYNSTSTLETSLSDPISGAGYDRNSVGFIIDEILREVSDLNEELTSRTEILGWFNEASDDLLTRVKKPYSFLHTRTVSSRVANDASGSGTTLAFPTDMWKFDFLEYNFKDLTVNPIVNILYNVRVLPLEEYRQTYQSIDFTNTSLNNDQLQFIAIDDAVSKFRLWPYSKTSASNIFYIYYWKKFTQLDSEGDAFETPTPLVYKLFALHKYYSKKATSDQTIQGVSTQYQQQYEAQVARLKRAEIKDSGSPKGFKYLPQNFRGNRQF